MRSIFLVAVISALAWARPETYKETEDFKFSRSSSDEGTKSGFYGAQRGNVGGNYERAHNMDSLAQNQMSGAVRQVEGELGDAAKTRTGSVFTAANSRGVYGSGHYDLSNLQGRNFAESATFDDTHSSLSSANQHALSSDWRSHSQQSGFGASNQFGQASLQAADDTNSIYNQGQTNFGKSYGHSSGFHSKSGYHSQSEYQGGSAYDHLSSNTQAGYGAQAGDQTQSRYVVTPVRIVGRPGTQVAIPVFARAYDSQKSTAFDQNAINSEAEVLNNNLKSASTVPQGNAKHYESSYDYRKAWERHSESNPTSVPVVVVPTTNPFPKNSELIEDSQASSGWDGLQNSNSGNGYNRHNTYVQSGLAQSRHHQSEFSSQHNSQAGSSANTYTQGMHGAASQLGVDVDSQPKSYQSAYSYHKSWERQGDPYVIVPATNGGSIAAHTKNSASSSHQQYRQSHQHYSQGSSALDCDCDDNGHPRAKRSYNGGFKDENLGQQTQDISKDLNQQTQDKFDSLVNIGQQTQLSWDNFHQQRQPEKLEDLGQQTQDLSQGLIQQTQTKFDSLEDFGQQTQQTWGNTEQQNQSEKLEDLGQQTQYSWDQRNIEQQASFQNLQDFPRRHMNKSENNQQFQQTVGDLENQQTQSKWDELSNLGQQTQQYFFSKNFTKQEDVNKNIQDLGQQIQNQWDNTENLGQQVQIHRDTTKKNKDTTDTEKQTPTNLHSVDQMKYDKGHVSYIGSTQHKTGNSDSTNSENSLLNNPLHPTVWGASNEQTPQNDYFLNQQNSNFNSYYNSQRYGANWQERANPNIVHTTENHPLQSLWNKIDNLEEQSEHSSQDSQFTGYEDSQHSYYERRSSSFHESTSGAASNSFHNNQYQIHYNEHKPPFAINDTEKTYNKSKNEQHHKEDETKNEAIPEIKEASEVGRGDIGPDDNSQTDKTSTEDVPVPEIVATQIKPEKSPAEIEALSLSRGSDERQNNSELDSLSVLSLNQQKWLKEQRQTSSNLEIHKSNIIANNNNEISKFHTVNENHFEKHLEDPSSVTTVRQYHSHHNEENESKYDSNQQSQDQGLDQQITGQQSEDFGEQSQYLNQENLSKFESSDQFSQNFHEQNTGQQLEDFGQHSQDLSQQNVHQLENFDQFEQSLDQQNTGQQSEEFGQQIQNLEQQNLEQFETSGKLRKPDRQNTGQKLEDFGQQSQDLNQQNLQQFEDLGQINQDIDQQKTGQQLEDLGQHSQNMNQQNFQQLHNLGQYSENGYKHGAWEEANAFNQFNQNKNTNDKRPKEIEFGTNNKEIHEEKIVAIDTPSSLNIPKQDVEILQPPTEKPGFWKSVGSKFTSAKDSVTSWFKRS